MMKARNGQRGVAAVEFAIVLPTLVLLCASAVGLGTAWRTSNRMQSIAHDAVRLCSLRLPDQQEACLNAQVNVDTVSTNCLSLTHNLIAANEIVLEAGAEVLAARLTLTCAYSLFPAVSAVPPITLTASATTVVN